MKLLMKEWKLCMHPFGYIAPLLSVLRGYGLDARFTGRNDIEIGGRKIAGWKVVEGRSVRKFTDDAVACARVTAAGLDPWEKKMLGVAGLEKLLGRKDFKNLLSDLVVLKAGKPLLVPVSDRRPEMDLAHIDFASDEVSDE